MYWIWEAWLVYLIYQVDSKFTVHYRWRTLSNAQSFVHYFSVRAWYSYSTKSVLKHIVRSIKNDTVKYSRNHLFIRALLLKYDILYSTVIFFIVYEICVYVLYMYSTTLHISIHYSDRKSNPSTSRRTL